ncbi:glutathione peroxidase [Nakamurella lactea]|uniref:glutathione peroxidase n=1 Tax=Nakamurella lactea TaxID=459515 RepID=UPI000429F6A1|nr:glutathione peroxidase [Nakamurella lactea]
MSIYALPLTSLAGTPTSLLDYRGRSLLLVNVASKCGLTPQYEGLEALQNAYQGKGLTVIGFPCNQFGGQEPGTAEEIATFCSATYGVTFPMMQKIDVNGPDRHPLYRILTGTPDAEGEAGDVRWNFEKFLVDPSGEVVARFRPATEPDAPELISAIEASLERIDAG